MKQILREIFSEGQYLSSKRVMGGIMMFGSLCCIIYLTITEGGTSVVENLLQTALIMSGGLMGISSVTGIWKQPKHTTNNNDSNKTLNGTQNNT